ncbi:hypothetical protein D3C76_1626440 [compost metagenome]
MQASISSQPIMPISSGTLIWCSFNALIAPIASRSEAQNTACGNEPELMIFCIASYPLDSKKLSPFTNHFSFTASPKLSIASMYPFFRMFEMSDSDVLPI